jgi:hypothetical protein
MMMMNERGTDARQPAELCGASLEKSRRPGRQAACCGDHHIVVIKMKMKLYMEYFGLEVELRITERSWREN